MPLSVLDVSVNPKKSFDFLRTPAQYALRTENDESTGVSLALHQTEDFVFSLKLPENRELTLISYKACR